MDLPPKEIENWQEPPETNEHLRQVRQFAVWDSKRHKKIPGHEKLPLPEEQVIYNYFLEAKQANRFLTTGDWADYRAEFIKAYNEA